jgi:hypothetical protein
MRLLFSSRKRVRSVKLQFGELAQEAVQLLEHGPQTFAAASKALVQRRQRCRAELKRHHAQREKRALFAYALNHFLQQRPQIRVHLASEQASNHRGAQHQGREWQSSYGHCVPFVKKRALHKPRQQHEVTRDPASETKEQLARTARLSTKGFDPPAQRMCRPAPRLCKPRACSHAARALCYLIVSLRALGRRRSFPAGVRGPPVWLAL